MGELTNAASHDTIKSMNLENLSQLFSVQKETDKRCILTRRKLKGRLLKVIRRLETLWREKDISQRMSKAPQKRTGQFVR